MARYKNFIISFVVCLIFFTVIASILMSVLTADKTKQTKASQNAKQSQNEKSNDSESTTDSKEVSNIVSIKGKTFAIIIGKTDKATGNLTSLILAKVDKENKRFVLSSLPTTVELAITGEDKDGQAYNTKLNFGELYSIFGPEYIMKKVYATTGIKVDYYMFFDDEGTKQLIDGIGGVTLTVPYDVLSYSVEDTEKQAPSIDIATGTQSLNGDKTVQLLDFLDNPKGEPERMDTYLKLVQVCLNHLFVSENKTSASKSVTQIISESTTNFTISDYNSNVELIFKYSSFKNVQVDFPNSFTAIDSQSSYSAIFDTYKEYK
jgi:Transcriptional regulator